jgi:hypothetical protein
MSPDQKAAIDSMDRFSLCQKWRFAPVGEPLLQGEAGDYFKDRMIKLGGFSPEISKELG